MSKLDQMMEIMNKIGSGETGLSEEMQKMTQEILEKSKSTTVEASSGGGAVVIEINLAFEVLKYELSEDFFEEDEDTQNHLIKSATQQLLEKLQSAMQNQFQNLMV